MAISRPMIRLDDGGFTDFIDEYVEPVKGKFVMD